MAAHHGKAGEAMRSICRSHVPAGKRRELWLSLAQNFTDGTLDYMYTAAKVFGAANPLPSKVYSVRLLKCRTDQPPKQPAEFTQVPFLGVAPYSVPESCIHLLRQPDFAMSAAHDRVVCCLAQTLGLRYCPMVPNLAFVLLEYLNEAETFAVIKSLYRHGGAGSSAALAAEPAAAGARGVQGAPSPSGSLQMFFTTKPQEHAFALAFLKHVKGRFPRLHGHIERLIAAGHGILDMFVAWFRGFFSGWLPHADVVRCVDVFLAEGPKALFRVGLAWLKVRKRQLKKCPDGGSFEMALRDWPIGGPTASQEIPYRFDTLLAEGFALRNLSKAGIFSAMSALGVDAAAAAKAAEGGADGTGAAWHAPLLLNSSDIILHGAAQAAAADAGPAARPPLQLFQPASAPTAGAEAAQMAAGGSTGTGGPTAEQWAAVKPHLAKPFVIHPEAKLREWSQGGHGHTPPPDSLVGPLLQASTSSAQSMLTTPQVASLVGLLPRAYKNNNCAVLFSSARHSCNLDTLYTHTAGVAPVLLLLQFSVDEPGAASAGSGAGAAAQSERGHPALRARARSSTVALFLEGGLAAPGQGAVKSGTWSGSRNDFLLQLEPDIVHFTAQKASELTVLPETGSAGTLHRQPFQIERMTACTKEMMLVGGAPGGLPPAFSLGADFNTASASRLLLEDLCIPVQAASDAPGSAVNEVPIRVGAVEALCFVDGFGGVSTPPAHANPQAAKLVSSSVTAAAAADAAYAEAMRD